MKIRTSELQGPALDWAVAKAEGMEVQVWQPEEGPPAIVQPRTGPGYPNLFTPRNSWSQGGPIIERERLLLIPNAMFGWVGRGCGEALHYYYLGPTLLIAAMRAFVASRLGDEVEIPEELL